jgi:hypothetical protein
MHSTTIQARAGSIDIAGLIQNRTATELKKPSGASMRLRLPQLNSALKINAGWGRNATPASQS